MTQNLKTSEISVLKEYKSVISNFLKYNNVEYDIINESETNITVKLHLETVSKQKAFNLGIKLQRYISEYTKIDMPKAE